MNYDERKVSFVGVHSIQLQREEDGSTSVSGSVRIDITSQDGGEHGPNVTVELAVPSSSEDPTIRGAERDLLAGARALLSRLAREETAALAKSLDDRRESDALSPYGQDQ